MPPRVPPEELERRAKVFDAAMKRGCPPWTVTALAAATGIHHGQVSRIVSGKASGSTAAIQALARVLRVDLNELLSPHPRPSFPPSRGSALDADEVDTVLNLHSPEPSPA